MFFLGIVIAIVGAAARNIGLSTSQISILVSVQNLGFMGGVLFAGSVADSVQKPLLLALGSLLLAATFVLFYAFEPFALNVAIMIVMGSGIGIYEAITDSVLLDIHEKNESLHVNINHMFVTVGSLVVTIYLIFLQMNWRSSMLQSAAAVFLLAVLFAFTRVELKRHVEPRLFARIRQFVGKSGFIISFLLLLIAVGAQLVVMGIMTTYLMEYRGHDQITSKLTVVLYLGGIGLGRLLTGYLTRGGKLYLPQALLFPFTVVISFVFFRFDTGIAVYPLALLLGLSISGLLPLAITTVGMLFREISGTAMGLMKMAIPIGGILIPLLVGAAAEVLPLPDAMMLVPLLFLIGTVLVVAGRRSLKGS
jgi:MFS family permease